MSEHRDALAWAEAQVAAGRDDPAARLALLARTYHGPTGRAPRHLAFRRAALSFMRWQAQRGLLNPRDAAPPGSVWWRAMNERLLRDGCEAIALVGGRSGEPSSEAVRRWLEFISLEEAQLVLAALAGLGQADQRPSALTLVALCRARSRPELERPFTRLLSGK